MFAVEKVVSIVVTYNGMQWIDHCIQSLLQSGHGTGIIIIDNGSSDATFSHIEQNYPEARLIKAGSNLGFGQGNNIGLKIALQENAEYVFLLNQDAWVERDTISKLISAHKTMQGYGILSPVHLNGKGDAFDDHFFNYLSSSAIEPHLFDGIRNNTRNKQLINTSFVNAAAWLVSRDCLLKTGGFDPLFFHYGEDDNYAQRVLYKGLKIGIVPEAFIYHDKERGLPAVKVPFKKRVARDWIQLLVYVCNVNDGSYGLILRSRILRYGFELLKSLCFFKNDEAGYYFNMLKKIVVHYGAIKRSRRIAVTQNGAYL